MSEHAKRLGEIVRDCLHTNEKGLPLALEGTVLVEGVVQAFGLHRGRLEGHREEVLGILRALVDDKFLVGPQKGGGASFLELCIDRQGNQWGEHPDCEHLVVLAAGLGLACYPLQRPMWPLMPGGMPYVLFSDPDAPDPAIKAAAEASQAKLRASLGPTTPEGS